MKAAVVHLPASLKSLAIENRPEPQVAPGSVKVRWHALSLNFHDYAVATGMMAVADGRIPVSDGAGEIVAVGEGVTEWRTGDRVMSTFFPDWHGGEPTAENTRRFAGDSTDGCASEYSLCRPDTLTTIPQAYSYIEAATLPCAALTAWRALVEVSPISAGDSVLVEGSGGASVFALQFANAMGARVYATSSSPEKCARLRKLGAVDVIDYKVDQNWGETIYKLAGGGVDRVLDIGGGATLKQSIAANRTGGTLVLVGMLGGISTELNLVDFMLKQQTVRPIAVGSHTMQRRMVRAIEKIGLRPVIDKVFSLGDIAAAINYQISGKHIGKIVIDMAA